MFMFQNMWSRDFFQGDKWKIKGFEVKTKFETVVLLWKILA